MTTTSELWVLEWSQRGNVFHVQELDRTLSFNRKLYANDTPTRNDYRILHVGTRAECSNAADAARGTLQERESTMRELVG